jgi:ATP-binding protein involved in chromosome partitioning
MIKRILVVCIKGGVGKTTVTCGVGLALKRRGRKVGIAEIDITGASIWKALGLTEPPPLECDTAAEKIIASKVKDMEIFTIASYYKARSALVLSGADDVVMVDGEAVSMEGTGKKGQVEQMLNDVRFSDDLDYLLYDLPPTIGDEILTLLDTVRDVWGVVIVSQPTSMSMEGLAKTVDLLTFKKLPLLGLIVNMDGVVCLECHAKFNPFADIEDLSNPGMPVIGRIPFTKELEPYFDQVAEYIEKAKPKKMGGLTLTQRIIDRVEMAAVPAVATKVLRHYYGKKKQ